MKQPRIIHRYLGFFLVGIMAVYALSGIVMIFRDTDFLKSEKTIVRNLKPNISSADLKDVLKQKDFKIINEDNTTVYFKNGEYEKATGKVKYTTKELPIVLNKMTELHKAKSGQPLFFLNVFFGISLLFFVISSFWMFPAKAKTFKNGMYFVLGGIVLTVILLLV